VGSGDIHYHFPAWQPNQKQKLAIEKNIKYMILRIAELTPGPPSHRIPAKQASSLENMPANRSKKDK
jgi:hypothetical protein